MFREPYGRRFNHGLSFLALLGFVTGFFGARTFAVLNPMVVVVQSGIHFHHFWYGLGFLAISGWLGIVRRSDRLDRIYALTYGLGVGFIGDEVGLLLTFGDYNSELTFVFFVGVLAFASASILLLKFRRQLERDVLSIHPGERTSHFGFLVLGLAVLFIAFDLWLGAAATVVAGTLLVLLGRAFEKRAPKG